MPAAADEEWRHSMRLSGNGSVQQLEKDKQRGRCRRWRLYQRTDDGSQHTRRFEGTYRQALEALAAFRDELAGQVPNEDTFEAYAMSWHAYRAASGQYAPGTMQNDLRNIRALCRTRLGGMRMDAVSPDDCRAALLDARDNPARGRMLSGTTMNKMHTCLSAIFRQAFADGAIASDPTASVSAPKIDTAERTWMPEPELKAFAARVSELPPDGRTMAVLLMAHLGLRRAEACALADADVDTVRAVAHIHEAVKERDGAIGEPKSRAGVRDLPMPQALCAEVERWRAVRRERGYGDAPTLCCNAIGGTLRPQNLQRWWDQSKDAIGAGGYTMHQLRHSNLFMMARFMSPFDLQKWAGWSSIAPARVYIHDDMASMRAAVARSEVHIAEHFVATSLPPDKKAGQA